MPSRDDYKRLTPLAEGYMKGGNDTSVRHLFFGMYENGGGHAVGTIFLEDGATVTDVIRADMDSIEQEIQGVVDDAAAAGAAAAQTVVSTLIKETVDGILVVKRGADRGVLVGSDGNFKVVAIDWEVRDGVSTPVVGDAEMTLGVETKSVAVRDNALNTKQFDYTAHSITFGNAKGVRESGGQQVFPAGGMTKIYADDYFYKVQEGVAPHGSGDGYVFLGCGITPDDNDDPLPIPDQFAPLAYYTRAKGDDGAYVYTKVEKEQGASIAEDGGEYWWAWEDAWSGDVSQKTALVMKDVSMTQNYFGASAMFEIDYKDGSNTMQMYADHAEFNKPMVFPTESGYVNCSGVASGRIWWYKVGSCVTVSVNGVTTSSFSQRSVIATLPSSVRPPVEVYGTGNSVGGTSAGGGLLISADGNVRLDSTMANKTLYDQVTYCAWS